MHTEENACWKVCICNNYWQKCQLLIFYVYVSLPCVVVERQIWFLKRYFRIYIHWNLHYSSIRVWTLTVYLVSVQSDCIYQKGFCLGVPFYHHRWISTVSHPHLPYNLLCLPRNRSFLQTGRNYSRSMSAGNNRRM